MRPESSHHNHTMKRKQSEVRAIFPPGMHSKICLKECIKSHNLLCHLSFPFPYFCLFTFHSYMIWLIVENDSTLETCCSKLSDCSTTQEKGETWNDHTHTPMPEAHCFTKVRGRVIVWSLPLRKEVVFGFEPMTNWSPRRNFTIAPGLVLKGKTWITQRN